MQQFFFAAAAAALSLCTKDDAQAIKTVSRVGKGSE
jgi:hypothetical protein